MTLKKDLPKDPKDKRLTKRGVLYKHLSKEGQQQIKEFKKKPNGN